MEYNTCHKCGRKIVTSFDEESMKQSGVKDAFEMFEKIEKPKGYIIGYTHTIGGHFGNTYDMPIKPICSICSKEQHEKEAKRELHHQIKKIKPQLKKRFVCPICEHDARSYNNEIFKSSNKSEMIKHLEEKHTSRDIEKVIR